MLTQVLELNNYAATIYALPTLVTTIALLALGIAVLIRERGSWTSLLFFITVLPICVWLFAFSCMYCAVTEPVALWWAKAAYLGVPFIPSGIYHFTVTVLSAPIAYRRAVTISWLLSAFFAIAIIGTNSLIGGMYQYPWGFYPQYSWLSVPYLTFFFGMMAASLGLYWVEYRRAKPGSVHQRRVRSLLLAFACAYLGSVDYLAKYGIPLYPFGYLPVLCFLIVTARTILRYRLVDITPALAAQPILEGMAEPLLVLDLEGAIQLVNRAACELFGVPAASLRGRSVGAIIGEAGVEARIAEAIRGAPEAHELEVIYRGSADADPRVLLISLSPVLNQAAQRVAVVGFLKDVTARRQAEASLVRIAAVAQGWKQASGSPPGADSGHGDDAASTHARLMSIPGLRTPWFLRSGWRIFAGLFATLIVPTLFLIWFDSPTTQHMLEIVVLLVMLLLGLTWVVALNHYHRVLLAVGRARERYLANVKRALDERTQAEAALRHLVLILDSSNEAIAGKLLDGTIFYWNPAAERLYGYSFAEVRGRSSDVLDPPGERQATLERLASVARGEAVEPFESIRVRKDGSRMIVSLSMSPIQDATGQVIGISTFSHDITERKRTDEALHRAHDELRQSHEALLATQLQLIQAAKLESVGRLAAGVAHEVKNPLAIIFTGVEYLVKALTSMNGRVSVVLADMHHAVKRADDVVRGLLDFSSLRELQMEAEDLNGVLERALLLVKHELDRAHVNVVRRLDPSLPAVRIDRHKIEQVFVNLFMNAVHAMPGGGTLSIATAAQPLTQPGPLVGQRDADPFRVGESAIVVDVEDTGAGIPEEKLSRVFDPFFTTKPTGQGTGLGLTVTRRILELHRGAIDLQNRREGGVRVRILLHEKGGDADAETSNSARG